MGLLRRVDVLTDSSGNFTSEEVFRGTVEAIEVKIGTLSTPDIDITDGVYGTSLLSVNGVAANTLYRPGIQLQDDSGAGIVGAYASPPIFGTLKVVVTGAGNAKSGTIDLLFSR